jgi:hypothetical protein
MSPSLHLKTETDQVSERFLRADVSSNNLEFRTLNKICKLSDSEGFTLSSELLDSAYTM